MATTYTRLLEIAVANESSAKTRTLEERLAEVLRCTLQEWEGLQYVTFATAFPIRGQAIADKPFNGLTEKDQKHTYYQSFIALTDRPPSIPGADWPWGLLRRQLTPSSHDEVVLGPMTPVCLRLMANGTGAERKERDDKITVWTISGVPSASQIHAMVLQGRPSLDDFDDDAAMEANCWRWYAGYPTVLADAIKGRESAECCTKSLVYILGTRKEFARRPETDYGLIVGLNKDVPTRSLPRVAKLVLAGWNVIAVGPHVLLDGQRIGTLEAAARLTHTFRTNIDVYTKPTIRKQCDSDEALEAIEWLSGLVGMFEFVARRGIADLRQEDYERDTYNLIAEIKKCFEVLRHTGQTHSWQLRFDGADSLEVSNFLKRHYLRAILNEVVKNLRNAGKKLSDDGRVATVNFEHTNSGGTEQLTVTVTNPSPTTADEAGGAAAGSEASRPGDGEASRRRSVSGEGALKAFFEQALGGSASIERNADGGTYETRLVFPIARWKEALAKLQETEAEGDDAERRAPPLPGADKLVSPKRRLPPENVALRVLLLDDEYELVAVEKDLHTQLPADQGEMLTWYEREFGNRRYGCLYYEPQQEEGGLEIVVANSLTCARDDFLGQFKDNFVDICLVDIDFEYDPEDQLEMGGLAFAIGLLSEPHTHTVIFTAKGEELRKNNPSFRYLWKLKVMGRLGDLDFEDLESKQFVKALRRALVAREKGSGSWSQTVLPRLRPRPADLARLARELREYQNADSIPRYAGVLRLGDGSRGSGQPKVIPNEILHAVLDEERKEKLSEELCRMCCGHALVHRLVAELMHASDDDGARFADYLKGEAPYRHLTQEQFREAFRDLCEYLFDMDVRAIARYRKQIFQHVVKLRSNKSNIDQCYRAKASALASGKNCGKYNPYLYNVWNPPDEHIERWEEIKKALKNIVIDKQAVERQQTPSVNVKCVLLDEGGKETTVLNKAYGFRACYFAAGHSSRCPSCRNDDHRAQFADPVGTGGDQFEEGLKSLIKIASTVRITGPHGWVEFASGNAKASMGTYEEEEEEKPRCVTVEVEVWQSKVLAAKGIETNGRTR